MSKKLIKKINAAREGWAYINVRPDVKDALSKASNFLDAQSGALIEALMIKHGFMIDNKQNDVLDKWDSESMLRYRLFLDFQEKNSDE